MTMELAFDREAGFNLRCSWTQRGQAAVFALHFARKRSSVLASIHKTVEDVKLRDPYTHRSHLNCFFVGEPVSVTCFHYEWFKVRVDFRFESFLTLPRAWRSECVLHDSAFAEVVFELGSFLFCRVCCLRMCNFLWKFELQYVRGTLGEPVVAGQGPW